MARKIKRFKKNILMFVTAAVLLVAIGGLQISNTSWFENIKNATEGTPFEQIVEGLENIIANINGTERYEVISLSEVPEYDGTPYVVINGNVPFFTEEEKTSEPFEYYSPLDRLGRCGTTFACISPELMPTEERGSIGMIKPSGWHTIKYDFVDGKYLYNRCHLIGYQLTAENANEQNLITGTRYMNVQGMLPFENEVADYIRDTGKNVLYRATPIFEGQNLVANGVLLEALSVEDDGRGIEFCVFIYNVQPGVEINYSTGESWLSEKK